MSLTGRFCFRRSFFGKVVLMVEEEKRKWPFSRSGATRKRWARCFADGLNASRTAQNS